MPMLATEYCLWTRPISFKFSVSPHEKNWSEDMSAEGQENVFS